ncbi:hypothetical protein BJF82_03250 [Kytococcus sp. CUA-901]|nr:hypothetical protein BJF82_03250 [Kytococcus sp. CUA-901]
MLALTNLFPTTVRPMGGTFVRERLAAHRSLGTEVTEIPVRMQANPALRLLLLRTGRDPEITPAGATCGARYRLGVRDFARLRKTDDPHKWVLRAADAVERAVRGQQFDVMHAHGMFRVPAGAVAAEVSRRTGVPYGITLHART